MIPDLNRLHVLHQVLECGGVSAAARTLNVTQSAVSQHLRKLEAEVGTPLFTRVQNRLVPTDAARRLFAAVDPFVRRIEEEMGCLDRARNEPFGLLRIGAPVEFGVHRLPRVLSAFREDYPAVSFHLVLGHPSDLLPRVEAGELDMAFTDIFTQNPETHREYSIFEVEPVADEVLVMVGSRAYVEKRGLATERFETLEKADYVAYQPSGAALLSWFRFHYQRTPRPLRRSLTVESVQGVIAGVRAGLGLGVVPSHSVAGELKQGELISVGRVSPQLINRISFVRLLDKLPTLTERHFAAHVRSSLGRETP